MRRWILIGIGALVALVVIAALAGGGAPAGTPTAPPVAGASATPTPTATAAATTEPTSTPEPTPTPEPVVTSEPTFATLSYSGRGNKVIRIALPDKILIAKATEKGTANFIVETLDSTGAEVELLVNTIGNYSGTVLIGAEGGSIAAIKIEADGSWTLAIKDVTTARTWVLGSGALTGKGDDVVIVSPPTAGLFVVKLANSGDENFIIYAYQGSDRDLVVNEIGPFTGEATLPDGTFLLQVEAVGGWSVTPI